MSNPPRRRWGRRSSGPTKDAEGTPTPNHASLVDLINGSTELIEAGDPGRGRALALQATKMAPESSAAWSNLAFAELRLGNLQAAQAAAERAVANDPGDANAWHNLGEAYRRTGDPERSLACNDRALALDPRVAHYWLGRGTALMVMKRFDAAVACFDKALEVNPRFVPARFNRALALLRADPQRYELLRVAADLARQSHNGRLGGHQLEAKVRDVFQGHPALDHALIQQFDAFAEGNLYEGATAAVDLCQINLILASLVGDRKLVRTCRQRLAEARPQRRGGGR